MGSVAYPDQNALAHSIYNAYEDGIDHLQRSVKSSEEPDYDIEQVSLRTADFTK